MFLFSSRICKDWVSHGWENHTIPHVYWWWSYSHKSDAWIHRVWFLAELWHYIERTKTITRVATGVKVIIPTGYIGVIHSKSGLVMEGIIAVTGVIDEDFWGEIRLFMHNTTEADYKVLKENPIAQMVVYCTDKLPATYHTWWLYTSKDQLTGYKRW